jgi:hypothetical protein
MRENAAMHGDAGNHRASASSLLPIALVAAAVLGLALLVHGGSKGTIVVQRVVEPTSRINGPQTEISFLTVTETSASGAVTRYLSESRFGASTARTYGSAFAGTTLEQYIPADNTVYVMSDAAYNAANRAYFARRFPGQRARAEPLLSFDGSWLTPGQESFFKVQLEIHDYQVAGRTTLDGHRTLKLVPAPGRNSIAFSPHLRDGQMQLLTAYVTPGSYHPIEERADGSVRYLWTEYRVLPATNANKRLLSLTAEFPHAHISYSPTAYIRALLDPIR